MNQRFKKIIVTVLALCLCFSLLQMPVNAEAAKQLKLTLSAKVVGGGDFLKNVSKLGITFKVNQSKDAVITIINDDEDVVYKETYKKCTANKKYSFNWDGKNSKGKYVEGGTYYGVLTVNKEKVETEGIDFYDSSDFAGGNGSKKNPYQVANIEQFYAIALHNGLYFKQTKNLDFSDAKYTTLFTSEDGFAGTYNGNGKTISNIDYSSEASYIGLFSCISEKGIVKNVTITDSSFVGKADGGVIAGLNKGSITDCTVKDSIVSLTKNYAAAIAGYNQGKISGCTSNNNLITCSENCGAIAGESNGNIKKCTTTDDIITCYSFGGGFVGHNSGTIDSCKAKDTAVTATEGWVGKAGGAVGYHDGILKKCEVNDQNNLISAADVGALVGDGDGSCINNAYYGELN